MKHLIQAGADIKGKAHLMFVSQRYLTTGNTPLHLACQEGNFELVKKIATPETIHLFVNAKNKEGKTAYEISKELNIQCVLDNYRVKGPYQNKHRLIIDYISDLTKNFKAQKTASSHKMNMKQQILHSSSQKGLFQKWPISDPEPMQIDSRGPQSSGEEELLWEDFLKYKEERKTQQKWPKEQQIQEKCLKYEEAEWEKVSDNVLAHIDWSSKNVNK